MSLKTYNFSQHQGISQATATALKRRFDDWEHLAAATNEQLFEVPGVGKNMVDDLRETALAQIRQAERSAARVEERVVSAGVNVEEQLFVLTEKPADAVGSAGGATVRNIKRRRKLLNAAICPKCGVDFAERAGVDWEKASAITRDQLAETVQKHIAKQHDLATQRIISGAEMARIGVPA